MRYFTITVILLLGIANGKAQDLLSQIENLDISDNKYSYAILLKNIRQANTELEKSRALNELAWFYNHELEVSINADSAKIYAQKAQVICEDLINNGNNSALIEAQLSRQILAVAAKRKGASSDSINVVFHSIKRKSIEIGDFRNLAEAYYNLGFFAATWDSTDFHLEKAIKISDSLGYYNTLAASLINMQMTSQAVGFGYKRKALKAYFESQNYVGLANALEDIGEIFVWAEQRDSARVCFNQAIEIAQKLDLPTLEANLHISIGWIYRKFGDFELALGHFAKAERASLLAKDDGLLAASYNGLGAIYDLQNNFPLALLNYLKAEPLFLKTKNQTGYAGILHNIGRVYRAQSRHKLALKYINLALKETIRLEKTDWQGFNYSELGMIYFDESEFSLALKNFRKVLKINESKGVYTHIDTLLIGRCFLGLKNYQKAFLCYSNSQKMDKVYYPDNANPDIPWRLSQFFYRLYKLDYNGSITKSNGEIISRKSYLPLAKQYIEQTIKLESEHEGYLLDKAQQSELYSKILFESGVFDKAYSMRIKSQELHDSIFNSEKEKEIAYIEYSQKAKNDSLEFAQKEKLQAVEIGKQKAKLDRQKLITLSALIGAAILGLLVFWVYRSRQKIAHQNQEKEVLLQEIHHRVKNNLSVIISMLRLQLRRVNDESGQRVLEQSIGRIKTMSLIHQNLYQSENLAYTNFKVYLKELMDQVMSSFQNVSNITYIMEGDELKLNTETAIPLALISFEWVNNIYKHAFDDKNGQITINMRENDAQIELTIADNGKGISKEEFMASKDSLGAKIIRTLSKQIGAELFIERRAEGGTELKLVIAK